MSTLDPTPPDVTVTSRDVYDPAEDSWLLLKAVAGDAAPVPGALAADVGTGSGIGAAWLAREGARRVLAVDVNPLALADARRNARALGVADRVRFARADLLTSACARFDVVAFNPPYLPVGGEDAEGVDFGALDAALHSGPTGVDAAVRFVRDLPRVLAPGGRAYLLLSDRGDVDAPLAAARAAGLAHHEVARDSFFFERLIVYRLTLAPRGA